MLAIEVTGEWLDHKHIRAHFAKYPKRFKPAINRRYVELYQREGRAAANLALLDITEAIGGNKALLAASDDEICAYAKARADECFRLAGYWKDADLALRAMIGLAEKYGIKPQFKGVEKSGQRARLCCELWWRRQLRKVVGRQVEAAAINLGMVSKRAGIYSSDETVARRKGQRRRNAALLETILAVNDEGQEYTLAQLSALGVSNPEIRRMELMARMAGFDSYSRTHGHAAEFYTITAPSRFHAVRSDGKPNPKYKAETPREAQAHLCKGWALSRAALAKEGIKVYGFRVVEPHHDGTPHWHMVLFMQPAHVERVREVLRHYALREDGDEFGASEHRFKFEPIDRKKGSAVGYLAKYISKNINGKGLEDADDFEGGSVTGNAVRVDAWAACWGIRQFQQIGGAGVGVWRELRRLGDAGDDQMGGILPDLVAAADAGDWAGYTALMGGAFAKRRFHAVKVRRVWFDEAMTRYDGAGMERVEGLETRWGDYVKTRLREWVLKRAVRPAWSSVNNCNRGNGDGRENGAFAAPNAGGRSAFRESEARADVSKGASSRGIGGGCHGAA
ncbi:replication endonuclease [Methylobacillus flagellatus]|uniref:Bacteriophage replication protein A n=3 Tax=root TaxID=1 RepID=Q1H2P4_METFK|nr:replication endonuclease [Methylobacillus flagellatus]ABE49099.1 bacteriophage replication protein A [Methylobacillus flagellatus KT]ABE49243.1 bacteriophage replication protein A [Methylobacillus flagellatus KT]ABZ07159.1 putative bacteriophage replication gene A protein (GPA) [uncultured marine microorganism HF4000_ANIW133B20]